MLTLFGVAVGLAVLFRLPESRPEAVARQARLEHPFRAYLTLLRNRRLAGYLLGGALNSACSSTYIASSSAVLIGVYGLSPTVFGLLFRCQFAGACGREQVNRMLLRHYRPDQILASAPPAPSPSPSCC